MDGDAQGEGMSEPGGCASDSFHVARLAAALHDDSDTDYEQRLCNELKQTKTKTGRKGRSGEGVVFCLRLRLDGNYIRFQSAMDLLDVQRLALLEMN